MLTLQQMKWLGPLEWQKTITSVSNHRYQNQNQANLQEWNTMASKFVKYLWIGAPNLYAIKSGA